MSLFVLQWNAYGLSAHGDELKAHLMGLKHLPHVICLQESFVTGPKEYKIPGYSKPVKYVRDNNNRGGVAIYVSQSLNFVENNPPPGIECKSIRLYINDTYYNI